MGANSATVQKLSDGTLRWSVPGFFTTLRVLAPGVIYCTASTGGGNGDHVFIPEVTEALEAEIAAHGHIAVFVNLQEAARLGGAARDSWAGWAAKHKQHMSPHFLVRSKLVEMGLSLIAMFSRADLRSYTDTERFLAAMRQAAPNAALPKVRDVA